MKLTTRQLTTGTRVLITNVRAYRGGNPTSDYGPARNPKRASYQNAPGELAGIVAATVTRVIPPTPGGRHYTVETDSATIAGVIAGQPWRPAPDDMPTLGEQRTIIAADNARTAAEREIRRDIDGTPTNVGDLVELLHQGAGGRKDHPAMVARVTAVVFMGIEYSDQGRTRLAPCRMWRRLADSSPGVAQISRSCGCPAYVFAWGPIQHLTECRWYDATDTRATMAPMPHLGALGGLSYQQRRLLTRTVDCPRPRCTATVGADCRTPNGYATSHAEREALAAGIPPKPKATRHRLTDTQAQWLEDAAESDTHRLYAAGQYATLRGDANARSVADAMETAGLIHQVGTSGDGHERVFELTDAGWHTYRTHRLIIRRDLTRLGHPDTCPCRTTAP